MKNVSTADICNQPKSCSLQLTVESHCFSVTVIYYKWCATSNNTEVYIYYSDSYQSYTRKNVSKPENINSSNQNTHAMLKDLQVS
jgi:hypothetical protein